MDKFYDIKVYDRITTLLSPRYEEQETIRGLDLPQADIIKAIMDRLGIKCRVIEYKTGGKQ